MSFGTSADSFVYALIFGLGLLASFPVMMLLVALIQRILGIEASGFRLVLVALIYVGGLLGASFYLDSAGTLVQALVIKKDDLIRFREEGDWRYDFQVQVQYQTAEGEDTSSLLGTSEAYFDSLHEGRQVQIRRVSINGWFDLARFADQSTWTWIPWRWIGIGLLVMALGWQLWSFNRKLAVLLISIFLLMLAARPFVLKYVEWRDSEDASRTPLQATGTVEEVRRVTSIELLPDDDSSGDIEVAQLYDIVVIRYTPQGYEESIRGVDAVDADTSPLTPGMSVEIAYSPNAPRTVRLPNRARSHLIRNPIAWLMQDVLAPMLLIGGLLLLVGLMNRRRLWRNPAAP